MFIYEENGGTNKIWIWSGDDNTCTEFYSTTDTITSWCWLNRVGLLITQLGINGIIKFTDITDSSVNEVVNGSDGT